MEDKGPLYEATKELHHAVEATELGRKMACGDCTPEEYYYWLMMKKPIYRVLYEQEFSPAQFDNYLLLLDDIKDTLQLVRDVAVRVPTNSIKYANTLVSKDELHGAAYVLVGGNVMGGRIIRKKLPRHLSKRSYYYHDEVKVVKYVKTLRHNRNAIQSAIECFSALLEDCRLLYD